ncbi:GHKL domain-containing protein [candidate division KSB1 bacterium]|nr:GHKL domain-containing protein [candidate division KSB1 bacterium]
MVYKNFHLNAIVRIVFLCATIFLLLYLVQNTRLYASMIVVGFVLLYQMTGLFRFVESTNRKITTFLKSISFSDFSQNFHVEQRGTTFDELNKVFNEVMSRIKQARVEKEEQYRYLQTVVQNIGIGLIIFRGNGEIDLINNAAKRLLRVRRVKHLDHLAETDPALPERFRRTKGGEQFLLKMTLDDQAFTYLVFVTDFIQQDRRFRLVTIQNIQTELEEKEMEAWQNLIRILTHEIMNSVTPVISLASTANSILEQHSVELEQECSDALTDIRDAIRTIKHRSEGLLQFVENYRKLTRVPKPEFEIFQVQELLDRVLPLFKANKQSKSVRISSSIIPPTLEMTADRNLIEQVLINLLKNAVEASIKSDNPKIEISAVMNDLGRPVIRVSDNGPGIEPHVIPNVFIPFFTTKPNGSGIGLSLARQIMRSHGGSLTVHSTPGEETVFTMVF